MEESINILFELIELKNFQEVGSEFIISGWVPTSWMTTNVGNQANRIHFEYFGMDCKSFGGGSFEVETRITENRQYFSERMQFDVFIAPFIEKSKGRIVIKIYGQDEGSQYYYLPLVVSEFSPYQETDHEIVDKHSKVSETIERYIKEIKEYNRELSLIEQSRRDKDKIFDDDNLNKYCYPKDRQLVIGLYKLVEGSGDFHENYLYSDEDRRERELNEKYKEALSWRGKKYRLLAGKINGFEIRIHSHDHDKHFHVIHAEKGINARFSFPDIELVNYKLSLNTISSREQKRIVDYVRSEEIFNKLKSEFNRRDQYK